MAIAVIGEHLKQVAMETEEKLIYMIQKHECLYNLQSKQYADKNAKHDAWRRISAEMNIPAPDCQKLWKNIRDGYRKSLQIKQKRGNNTPRRKDRPIKFERELEFIKPFLQNTPRLSKRLTSPEEPEISTDPESQSMSTPQYEVINRAPTIEPSSKLTTYSNNVLKQYMLDLKQQDDPTISFFLTMGRTVQRMPPKTQAEIKREIFRIVNEAEFRLSDRSVYSLPSTSVATVTTQQGTANNNTLAVPTGIITYNETNNGYVLESTSLDGSSPAYIIHPVPVSREFCTDLPLVKSENESSIKTEYESFVQ